MIWLDVENNKLGTHKQPVKKLISYLVLGKTSSLCLNMPLIKLIKTILDTILLIIYYQRHISALQAIFRLNTQLWYELYITKL